MKERKVQVQVERTEKKNEIVVRGTITKTFYVDELFSIRQFEAEENVIFPNGKAGFKFSVKGNFIPPDDAIVVLTGTWDPKPLKTKYGTKYTLNVTDVQETREREKKAIIRYLRTINGIGDRTARLIFEKFGEDVYDILDNDIERLKEISTIGEKKFKAISRDYLSRGIAKGIYTYFYKFDVPNSRIEKIFTDFKERSIKVAKDNPYDLCLRGYLSFNAAEKIAAEENIDKLHDDRIKCAIKESLKRSESQGNTYTTYKDLDNEGLLRRVIKLLGFNNEKGDMLKEVKRKIDENIVSMGYTMTENTHSEHSDQKAIIYLKETADSEFGTAKKIVEMLKRPKDTKNYFSDIKRSEEKLGISLSDEQEHAVQLVMESPICVVTGGPGTGKTTFQQVLLDVYKKNHPKESICMGAPTGRAARRMTESSGMPARTLHQILKLAGTDDGNFIEVGNAYIDDGLVIVDEVSMLDIFLSKKLFESLSDHTKIVCIGDIYQLPSVGAGAVLKSMIDSGTVPVAKFTKIFRQEEGSCIATNAMKINQGLKDLEYNDAFQFIEKNTTQEIVDAVVDEYKKATEEFGVDEVTVLTPYRRSTATGVNELNPVLKQIINPLPKEVTKQNKVEGMPLYLGDRVMFTKNIDDLTNGDIGYIIGMKDVEGLQVVICDFGDGRIAHLTGDDLKNLVPAYATTIHKSQGSEYQCCIIVMDPQHMVLLKRNLTYTAITRAKKKVVLIGNKSAFFHSIDVEDTSKRNSQLDLLIRNGCSESA